MPTAPAYGVRCSSPAGYGHHVHYDHPMTYGTLAGAIAAARMFMDYWDNEEHAFVIDLVTRKRVLTHEIHVVVSRATKRNPYESRGYNSKVDDWGLWRGPACDPDRERFCAD